MKDENEIILPPELADIAPISDRDFHNVMSILVEEPEFEQIVGMVMPQYRYSQLKRVLLGLNSKRELQIKVMRPFVEGLLARTTDGVTASGLDELDHEGAYTFVTNHRDIVLDSAQLNCLLMREGMDTCEIAIGNNLLIYDWINKLVRLNKCFIVKRNLGRIQTLAAAIQLSKYIHYAIADKHNSVWISQREGRCKDSNDRTQEGVIKMLAYGNRDVSLVENIRRLNIAPIAISYEYDPNDYLKAKEFLMKSKDPNWHKSPADDLLSMRTGILGRKGAVHYAFTPCINDELDNIPEDLDKFLTVSRICNIIDHAIHSNYHIFKTNYIAHDLLFDDHRFEAEYTPEEREAFTDYLSSQIAKVDIKLSEFDRYYMLSKMLQMYSNPLTNQLEALK